VLQSTDADPRRIVECFEQYITRDNLTISRAEFEENLAGKLCDDAFLEDLHLLLPADIEYDPQIAATVVLDELVARIPGEPWKGHS
jgi:hypothetical protein